jgi:putative ABC transport system permease protein
MALVGILTAIDGIKAGLIDNFSTLGANTMNIKNRAANLSFGARGKKVKEHRRISFAEALMFKKRFTFPSTISISYNASGIAVLKCGNLKTNPNTWVLGADENYLQTAGYSLASGRPFTEQESMGGAYNVILGKELKEKLFKNQDAIGRSITINSIRYQVVGVLEEKGASMGFNFDRIALIPIQNARARFPRKDASYVVTLAVSNIYMLDPCEEEAIAAFRNIRRLGVLNENNFEILRSDSLTLKLFENLSMITTSATMLALLVLLGAAIGLMNIMLVSVAERTREIGTRKALGATPTNIRLQFLLEAVIICVLGGLGGVVLGVVFGNVVGSLMGGSFIVPWNWMFMGITVCCLVGLLAGYIPAQKASRLAPVEALRHE